MTDWRAVATGAAAAVVYLVVIGILPGLHAVRLEAVPLVLGTGLVAGAAAGLLAGRGPAAGAWHGLLAGCLAGGVFAVVTIYVFSANEPYGVFHALNYLVASSASSFPIIASHGPIIVGAVAGTGWAAIAGLGLIAGRRAPMRETASLVEE